MAQREKLKAEKREITGKKVRKLRREGIIPANIYGADFASMAVQLPTKEFDQVFGKVRETGLVDLTLDGSVIPVLIKNVQINPVTEMTLHADFHKVNLKEKITAKVPVEAIGEAKAQADKVGLLEQPMMELEVEALPTDLPEKIEVNVEKLAAVDEQILASDIIIPTGVTLVTDGAQVVFKIGELITKEMEEQMAADEAATEEAAAAEGEAKEEGAKEESEGEEKEGEDKKEASSDNAASESKDKPQE
ncbi:MAG: 50S ribosomal protein L25 [Candidatus Levybacteria bacterium]|nr:50S ribosomal protein L25 [Candidatus Levybacteria bacterium]MBP9815120.1 50S ribosomal protein L25 [Candidatus Levybacteria bacterium]